AIGMPVHRRVLAQPGELLVGRSVALIDVGVDEVDRRNHIASVRVRLPRTSTIRRDPRHAEGTIRLKPACSAGRTSWGRTGFWRALPERSARQPISPGQAALSSAADGAGWKPTALARPAGLRP